MNNFNYADKVELLSNVPHEQFTRLCAISKEFSALCSGKIGSKIILVHGDLSELIYEKRSHNFIADDILVLKDPSMTWKEFYERITYLQHAKKNVHLANYYMRQGKIMELAILSNMNPPILPMNL